MAVVPYRSKISSSTLPISDNKNRDLEKRVPATTGNGSGSNSFMNTSSEVEATFHDEGWSWAHEYRGREGWERVELYSSRAVIDHSYYQIDGVVIGKLGGHSSLPGSQSQHSHCQGVTVIRGLSCALVQAPRNVLIPHLLSSNILDVVRHDAQLRFPLSLASFSPSPYQTYRSPTRLPITQEILESGSKSLIRRPATTPLSDDTDLYYRSHSSTLLPRRVVFQQYWSWKARTAQTNDETGQYVFCFVLPPSSSCPIEKMCLPLPFFPRYPRSLPLGHGRRSNNKPPKRATAAQLLQHHQSENPSSSSPNRGLESATLASPPRHPAMMNALLSPTSIPLPPISSNHSQPSPAIRPQTLMGSPASRHIKSPAPTPAVLAPRRQPPPPPAPLLSQPTLAPAATARLTPPSAPAARLTPPSAPAARLTPPPPPPTSRKTPSPRVQQPPLQLPPSIPVSQVPLQYRPSLSSQRPSNLAAKPPQHERRVSTGSENSDSDNINPSSRIPPPGLGGNNTNMMGIQHSRPQPPRGYTNGYVSEKDRFYNSSSSSDRDRKEREKKSGAAAHPHPAPVYVNTAPRKPTRAPPPPPVQTQAPPPTSFVRPPPSGGPRNVRFRNTLQFSATPPGSIPPSPTHSRRPSQRGNPQQNLHPLTGTNRNAASPNTSPSHKPLHPLTPSAYPVSLPTPVKRVGWYNSYGDQLWTNEGGYVAPPPGMENPPELANYPRRGKGWMNENGRVIDMQHRLLRDGWGAGDAPAANAVAPAKKEPRSLKSALKKRS